MAKKEDGEVLERAYDTIKGARADTLGQTVRTVAALTNANPAILNQSLPDSQRTLFHAAASKDAAVMDLLLRASAQKHSDANVFDKADSTASTPLAEAAAVNNHVVVANLLKQGANASLADDDGNTPLHHACRIDAIESVQLLLGRDPKPLNVSNVAREKPIHIAAACNSCGVLKLILEQTAEKVDVNETMASPNEEEQDSDQEDDSEELTPLCCAAKQGHVEAIRVLLTGKFRADPHRKCLATDDFTISRQERTALMIAARRNHEKACRELLAVAPGQVLDAIEYASVGGDQTLMKTMMERGKTLLPDNKVYEALRLAANFGNYDAFRNLTENFKNVASTNKEQLLRDAVTGGCTDIVAYCLSGKKLNCDPNQKDRETWETAVHKAALSKNSSIMLLLLRRNGDAKALSRDKQTPLSLASQAGNFQVVKVLLEHGADPTRRVKLGDEWHTSLEIAVKSGSEECAMAMITMYKAQVPNAEDGVRTRKPPMWYRATTRRAFHEAVKTMPKAACAMLDWRVMQYGSMSSPTFTLVLGFELLDDAYIIEPKKRMPGKTNLELYYEQCQETPWQDFEPAKMEEKAEPLREKAGTDAANQGVPEERKVNGQPQGEAEATVPWLGKPALGIRKKAVPFTDSLREREKLNVVKMMVDNNQEEILSHPVVLAFLTSKWNAFAKYAYYSLFAFYCLFLVMLSAYAACQTPPYVAYNATAGTTPKSTSSSTPASTTSSESTSSSTPASTPAPGAEGLRYAVMVLIVINIALEGIQLGLRKMQYIVQASNYLDWFVYIGAFLFVFPEWVFGLEGDPLKSLKRAQWFLGAAVVFLAWVRLLLFVIQMPALGIYVVMCAVVMQSFLMFAVVYVLFLLMFCVCFYMLLRDLKLFGNFSKLLLKIIVMTVGELEYSDLFGNDNDINRESFFVTALIWVVYLAFVVVMTVVVMNLLVGIAVQDIREVYTTAQLKKLQSQANLILDVEMMLPEPLRRRWVTRGRPLYVKQKGKPVKQVTAGDNPNPTSDDGILFAFLQAQRQKSGVDDNADEDPLARRRMQAIAKSEQVVETDQSA